MKPHSLARINQIPSQHFRSSSPTFTFKLTNSINEILEQKNLQDKSRIFNFLPINPQRRLRCQLKILFLFNLQSPQQIEKKFFLSSFFSIQFQSRIISKITIFHSIQLKRDDRINKKRHYQEHQQQYS